MKRGRYNSQRFGFDAQICSKSGLCLRDGYIADPPGNLLRRTIYA
jgi:hypothetical protein